MCINNCHTEFFRIVSYLLPCDICIIVKIWFMYVHHLELIFHKYILFLESSMSWWMLVNQRGGAMSIIIIMNSLFQIKKRVAMRVAKVSRVQLSLVGGTSRASGCSYPPRCVWARAPLWVVAGHLQAVRPEDPRLAFISLSVVACPHRSFFASHIIHRVKYSAATSGSPQLRTRHLKF